MSQFSPILPSHSLALEKLSVPLCLEMFSKFLASGGCGLGGVGETLNGQGGFSYYNPQAVVLVLDARSVLALLRMYYLR